MDNSNPKYFEDFFSNFNHQHLGQSLDLIRNTALTDEGQDLQTREGIIDRIYPSPLFYDEDIVEMGMAGYQEHIVHASITNPEKMKELISAGFRFTSHEAAGYAHLYFQDGLFSAKKDIALNLFTRNDFVNVFEEWKIHKQKNVLLNAIEESAAALNPSRKRII